MSALKRPVLLSIAEYLAGERESDRKHEFVGGVVYAMAGGNNRHNTIAVNLIAALSTGLRGQPCQAFNSDTKVRINFPDHTRFYYPDAMVVCAPNPETDDFQDQPVLVAEVLSESTRRTDLTEKRDAYLTLASLKVLMLVEPDQPAVTVHRRDVHGGFVLEAHEGLETVFTVSEIGISIELADLYDRLSVSG
jgi:Uma2 family endonuclease